MKKILVILAVFLILIVLAIAYIFLGTKNNPLKSSSALPVNPSNISVEQKSTNNAGANKELDATVQVAIDQIAKAINIYYANTKRLPKNLEEISTLPDLSYFKVKNNPITDKPYTYIPKSDETGFTVSGTLSSGTEYKLDIPIN